MLDRCSGWTIDRRFQPTSLPEGFSLAKGKGHLKYAKACHLTVVKTDG